MCCNRTAISIVDTSEKISKLNDLISCQDGSTIASILHINISKLKQCVVSERLSNNLIVSLLYYNLEMCRNRTITKTNIKSKGEKKHDKRRYH